MTREPDPIETQIRSLIGFHCTDQDAFVEMVAWLDRTVGRIERLEDDNAKLKAKADRAWEDVLWEREQHANRLAAAKAAAPLIAAKAWDEGYAEGGRGRMWDSTNPYRWAEP